MTVLAVNGANLSYVQAGLGVPLICLHGYPLDHALWQPQLDDLADVASVLAPDLRGFGQSTLPDDAPANAVTMEAHADDVRALMDALEIPQAVLCGLSMGGYIALAFWRKYAARVCGLILADTRAGADAPAARQARLEAAEHAQREGVAAVAEPLLPRLLAESTRQSQPELVASVRTMMLRQPVSGVVGAQLGMAERPDSTPLLPALTVPTLCVFGAEDVITPAETEGRALAAAIPGARLVVVPNAGHLSNLEQPSAFNAAARNLVRELRRT